MLTFQYKHGSFSLTARLQASSPNNAGTIATVSKSEFSDDNDFDEGHEPEEESIPNDGN